MAYRKKQPKDDRIRRIEEFGELFSSLLADLSKLECPLCNSRLLSLQLIAHSGIIFHCDGELDTLNNDAQLDPYVCTYRYRVPYRHIARLESLEPFIADEPVIGVEAGDHQSDPEDVPQ